MFDKLDNKLTQIAENTYPTQTSVKRGLFITQVLGIILAFAVIL